MLWPTVQPRSKILTGLNFGYFFFIKSEIELPISSNFSPKKPILNGDEHLAPDDVEEQGNYIDRMGGGYGWPLILIGMAVATVILSVYAL